MDISTSSKSEPSPDSTAIQKTSSLFCDPNADVTFISVDGVTFKIYSKYFAAVSAGFAAPETVVDTDQPVTLSESAEVLEILFQFIHPPSEYQRLHQPSVADMKSKLFFDVAIAAEKYVVYGAMSVFVTRMRYKMYTTHPVQVLNHAANHGYDDLADLAATQTISLPNPIEEVLLGLSDPRVAVKWTRYYGHWAQIPKFTHNLFLNSSYASCSRLAEMNAELLRNFTFKLTKIDIGTPKSECNSGFFNCDCRLKSGNWVDQIKARVAAIPKFSQISW